MEGFDPARPDMTPYGFSCTLWTPTRMPRSDRHNEVELNFLERGRLVYLLGGRKVEVRAGALTAFWACVPHQIRAFEGVDRYYVMTIPLTWFLQWRLCKRLAHGILNGEVLADASRSTTDPELFAEWTDDLASPSRERHRACALEVEARITRLASSLATPGRADSPGTHVGPEVGLSYAEKMAGFVALHYRRAISVEEIAASVGLHPNYAMTLFQEAFGTTLVKHLTQHRLHHAQRLLAVSDDKATEIAFACGFGSVSRFYESFGQAFGCTPRQFRASIRAGR